MLIFRLKKKWWDKVISGEKTHEYREYGQYWGVRLFNESQKIYWKRWHSLYAYVGLSETK